MKPSDPLGASWLQMLLRCQQWLEQKPKAGGKCPSAPPCIRPGGDSRSAGGCCFFLCLGRARPSAPGSTLSLPLQSVLSVPMR